MGQKNLISGIFIHLKPSKDTFQERSMKWWVTFIIILATTGIVLVGLVFLATRSHSGIGVQVVSYTFLFGIIIFITSTARREMIQQQKLTIGRSNLFLILVFIILAVIMVQVGVITIADPVFRASLPEALRGTNLPTSLAMGGVVFSLIVLLLYEGYPILSERGSPGFIAMSGLLIVFAIIYMTLISWWIVPYDPTRLDVGPYGGAPSQQFPLGTTALGQDLLSRTITGGGIMLQVAMLSVVLCFSVGVPLGLAASFKGGAADRIVSLVMDSIFAFPGLVLAIAIAAMLGPGVANMALAIAVVYIPSYFRVVRSQVLTVKELPYIEAAIVMGARNRDIIFRYILPNILPSAVVVMTINFADAVLTAAGLTFVGLGLSVDVPDWGWDLTFGSHEYIAGRWWSITFPGLMIVILALGFTLAGEGLNEVLTPKLKE
ncbi:ABC transporter permease [Candidatus Thorarchaeota archaeon]|nr:MAG: ABC transporter permease [Candidatus Thorarchaeota archaeon]